MAFSNTDAARGTAVLVFSQACFFILGYFVVVLLARGFGPVTYGAYGVIMSVLVWLEESARFAIPSATAKLVAEKNMARTALECAALTLNLAVHAVLFVLLWMAAPWLASWFGIPNGTFLFRIAAIDLPFFGAYTAYRAIHQGHRRFFRLGCSQVIYAFSKLVGVLLLVRFGLSVENALLVNVGATIVGLAWLFPGGGLRWQARWLEQVKPLVSTAAPIGLYYFVLGVRDSLALWMLQVMSPASEAATIGVFVAAFNIARVPSMVLTTVTTVILPSLSRALALNDEALARRYINQALRFGVIFYLPVCLVFLAHPEKLIQWIFSKDFSGGGVILSLLAVEAGLRVVHAIFGTVLNAAGEARKAAVVTIATVLPSVAVLVFSIYFWGAAGAALSRVVTIVASCGILGIMVWKRFGALMNKRSTWNIGVAGGLMFLIFALLSGLDGLFILPYAGGLAAYVTSLLVSQEITRQDFAAFVPWIKLKGYQVSSG
jgi:O-antigen/teichoic acid export membrane protein